MPKVPRSHVHPGSALSTNSPKNFQLEAQADPLPPVQQKSRTSHEERATSPKLKWKKAAATNSPLPPLAGLGQRLSRSTLRCPLLLDRTAHSASGPDRKRLGIDLLQRRHRQTRFSAH